MMMHDQGTAAAAAAVDVVVVETDSTAVVAGMVGVQRIHLWRVVVAHVHQQECIEREVDRMRVAAVERMGLEIHSVDLAAVAAAAVVVQVGSVVHVQVCMKDESSLVEGSVGWSQEHQEDDSTRHQRHC